MSGLDVFISYARTDRPTARIFAQALVEEGFTVWWDASLHSGETFDEVIEQNLRDSKAVVVLWSPRSVASRWVRAEATLADRRKKLVPAIIEPCDRPIVFELTHTAELSGWAGDLADPHWRTFVEDLGVMIKARSADALAGSPTQAPAPAPTHAPTPSVAQARPHTQPVSLVEPAAADGEGEDAAPAPLGDVHYLEMEPGELINDPVAVTSSSIKIGRVAPADIVLPHKSVSREHCVVGLANDELFVTDLNSTNGTYIDDVRVLRATILPVGSVLRVGEVTLRHAVKGADGSHGASHFHGKGFHGGGRLAAAS